MTKQEQIQLKEILLNEKKETEEEIRRMKENNPEGSLAEWTDELSTYDNHPADLGTETFEMEKNMALTIQEEKLLRDINDALIKMEEGAYGTCEHCGKPISYDRLKAIAYAKECIDCAKEHQLTIRELDEDRPQEEKIMRHTFGRHFPMEEQGEINNGTEVFRALEAYGSSDSIQDIGKVKDYKQINELYDLSVDQEDEVHTLSNAHRENQ
jgi:YteA family regulatory protein